MRKKLCMGNFLCAVVWSYVTPWWALYKQNRKKLRLLLLLVLLLQAPKGGDQAPKLGGRPVQSSGHLGCGNHMPFFSKESEPVPNPPLLVLGRPVVLLLGGCMGSLPSVPRAIVMEVYQLLFILEPLYGCSTVRPKET